MCLEACSAEWRTRGAVEMVFVLGYEIFGKEVVLGREYSCCKGRSERGPC